MLILGVTIDVTPSASSHYSKGVMGGLEPDERISVSTLTSNLAQTPEDLNGVFVKLDGVEWKIEKVRLSEAITTLDLISPNEI